MGMTFLLNRLRHVQFRGKRRLVTHLVPTSGKNTAEIFGNALELDLSNYVDRTIFMGCYEPLNTWLFKQLLRTGGTAVDVGANIGYFTLLAASLVGAKGKVIAVEAHPANFEVLSSAVQRNRLEQVLPVNVGLSDENGSAQIIMADQNEFANRTASMVPQPQRSGPTIPLRTLDECLDEWRLDTVDLLKIDVDGFETKVLRGATQALSAGRVRNVIVELDDYWLAASGSSGGELTALLERTGFREARHPVISFLMGATADRHFTRRH
jgi:FkbM family methyltransferase